LELGIGVVLDLEGDDYVIGTEKMTSYPYEWGSKAEIDYLDVSIYKSGNKLEWDTFEASGYAATGIVTANNYAGFIDVFLVDAVKEDVAQLAQVLGSSGLGLTMADIGFTSY
jgi:hypothetical protein